MTTVTSPFYTDEEIGSLNKGPVPRHIAFIMDGNRRWAKERQRKTEKGHDAGADVLMDIVEAASDLGVEFLTCYTFSTENWNRPKYEVAYLMRLLSKYLTQQRPRMIEKGVRVETIGELSRLPKSVQKVIAETQRATSHCEKVTLILALNYGSRDEIARATRRIIDDYDAGEIQKEQINEQLLSTYLDTAPWPDPELLIRPGGEMRISNFLLWQLSYAEIYATETLWPSFTPRELLLAISEYQRRERRLGT